MFKLIVLLTLVAKFGFTLSDPTSPEASVITENVYSSSASETSSSSFSQSTTSESYVSNSENTINSQCTEGNEQPIPAPTIKPRPPIVKPTPPIVKPTPPIVKPGPPIRKPTPPVIKPVDCNQPPIVKPKPPVVNPDPPVTTTDPPSTTIDPPTTTPSNTSISNGIDEFNKGNTKFTASFFNNVVQSNPGKSVIMSVYSTLFLLALLGYFSVGQTQTELLTPMNFKNIDEIPVVIPAILDSIREQTNVNISLCAKTYGNENNKFSDNFLTSSKEIINAPSETLNFKDPEKSAAIINKWVADNTNNKIQDLVSPFLLQPDTELVLANAFYFKGEWSKKFDNESTISAEFYKSDNTTVMVDTMNQVKYFRYAEIDNLSAQALELPYVNDNLTCLILLPREIGGAANLVSKLTEADDALSSVLNNLEFTRVALSLPKYKTSTSLDLKDIFEKLGITSMFDPEKTELTGILADPTIKILVTAAIQKAYIEINESGSEAAAANAITGVATAVFQEESPTIVNANHDFVYHVLFRGTPIFCGLFAGD